MGKNKPTLSRPTQRMTKRERTRWETERRIQRNLILVFAGIGVISILLIAFALFWDNVAKPGRVIARVNNEPIYLRDYWGARRMDLINQYQQQIQTINLYQQYGITMTQEQTTQFQQSLQAILIDLGQVSNEDKPDDTTVQNLVQEKLLDQGAREMGIEPTDQDVTAWLFPQTQPESTPTPGGIFDSGSPTDTASVTPTVEPTPAPTLSPQEQRTQLEQQWGLMYDELGTIMKNYLAGDLGFSRGEYLAMVNHSLQMSYLQQKVQDKLAESLPKTEDQVYASQILISDRAARAQEAESAAKGGSLPFPTAVVKYTDDDAGRNKIGDLGLLFRGENEPSPEVEAAAYAMTDTNKLSPVVADASGLNILQYLGKDPTSGGVHVRRILLPLDRKPVADSVLTSLQGGADFSQTAQSRSEDTATASSGGDMGWITQTATTQSQTFVDAAFALSGTNALSPVIEDDAGYHILQLVERDDTNNQVHVRQILILKAPAFAQKVLDQINGGTLDFSQAAASYSIDQGTVDEAGDLGWIGKNDTTLPKAVVDAAWAITETNGITSVLDDNGVTHIVQVWGRNEPDQLIRLREIQIKPAQQLAEEIRSYIVGGGEDLISPRFFEKAMRYSNDSASSSKGGDLGWFGKGAYPEIEQVAFEQQPGTVSDAFQGPTGYYIVWTREHDTNHALSEDAINTKAKAAYDEWLKGRTDAATVQRFPPSTPTPAPTAAPTIESAPAVTGTVTP